MSGPQLASRLRQQRPVMKVLFASGYTESAIANQQLLEKGVPFLQKPITPNSLLRRVRETLDAPRIHFD